MTGRVIQMDLRKLLCGIMISYLCLGAVSAQQPPTPLVVVNGALGGSVDFNLYDITIPQNYQITWSTGGTIIGRISNNNPPFINPDYENRCQLFPNGTLRLEKLTRDDEGRYTVTIEAGLTTKTVTYKLKVYTNVSDVTLHTNSSGTLWADVDSVLLQCSARGSKINFSWSLNGTEVSSKPPYSISSSSSTSNLTISPVSKSDTGPFICTATNKVNSENSSEINFHINWRPDGDIKCLSSPHNDYITFTCAWENGNPHANVTMAFNGKTETKTNIVFRNVSLHAGGIQGSDLTCSGDQLGRTSMCSIPFAPPQSSQHYNNKVTQAIDGQPAVLRVKLDSTSTSRNAETAVPLPATFVWYRYNPGKMEIKSGGEFIVNSTDYESTLSITNLTPDYAGKYECTATNMDGSQSFIFDLTVTRNAPPPQHQWSGGEIAGIVIGTVAGIIILVAIAILIFRWMKECPQSTAYGNTSADPPPPYEMTLPRTEQLMLKDDAHYHTLVTSFRK